MGLGGFAFALLGCDTVVSDTAEVVSLLQRNYENNLSPAALRGERAKLCLVTTCSCCNFDKHLWTHCLILMHCTDPCQVLARGCLQVKKLPT